MADLDPLRRFPTLVTDRLILRDTTMMDAAQVSKILSDPCVSEYYGVDHVTDLERSREIISLRQERFQRGEAIRWAIALAENNLYLGSVEIRNKPGDPGCAELGYELSPEFWGQGFMNEALREAIEDVKLIQKAKLFFHN